MSARYAWIFFLPALVSCARSLPPSEWVTQLPEGACAVTVTRFRGGQPWSATRHYDAEGHLLSGAAIPNTWERFEWDGDRLRAIHSYHDRPAIHGDCDVEGGCDEPPQRVVSHTEYDHDAAGRITESTFVQRRYALADGTYRQRRVERRDVSYAYDSDRLLSIRNGDSMTRFRYEGERLTHVDTEAEYPRHVRVEQDSQGRVARWTRETCTRQNTCRATWRASFTYDEEERLIEVVHDDPSGEANGSRWTWEWDGDRLRSTTEEQTAPSGDAVGSVTRSFEYDEAGRLVTTLLRGSTYETRSYEGECSIPSRPPPSPLDGLGARLCLRSPHYVLDQCPLQ